MTVLRTTALVALLASLALAGCGSDGGGTTSSGASEGAPAAASTASAGGLIDPSSEEPPINSFSRDEATGEYLLTTNAGFFRIDPETKRAREVSGRVVTESREAPVGSFLNVLPVDGGERLLGSGHPDTQALPEFLGLIESDDGGRTWSVVSRLGEADFHRLIVRHGRLYAYDAVVGAVLVSDDGGRTFDEHLTPRSLGLDLAIDPEDPDVVVLTTQEGQLHRSTDGGSTWRAFLDADGMRLAWPEGGPLVVGAADGTISVSEDGGRSFEEVGRVDGAPARFLERGPDTLDLVLEDATILRTQDGGATWETVAAPPFRLDRP